MGIRRVRRTLNRRRHELKTKIEEDSTVDRERNVIR